MSIVTDLQALDLSGIVNARASISVSVGTDDFTAMVSGGAAVTALGDFGVSLRDLQARLDDPATFVRPLIDAIGPLEAMLAPDLEVFGRYRRAVEDGARIAGGLLGSLDADPALFGQAFGRSLGDAFGSAATLAENYLPIRLDELTDLRALIDRVDGGVSIEPARFAELALDVLAPFPRAGLGQIRASIDELVARTGAITIDASVTAPLVAAFDAVGAATTEAQLEAALSGLDSARASVLGAIEAQVAAFNGALGAIPIDDLLAAVTSVGATLRTGEQDVLRYLELWRRDIARARTMIEEAEVSQLLSFITALLDQFEARARTEISAVFDLALERLKEWVRGLLGHLGLRALRNAIRDFILRIAAAIRGANLDAAADEIRGLLATIRGAIGSADLGGSIRTALEAVEAQVTAALGGVIAALETIGTEVAAVAGTAQETLERAATVLAEFRATADGITAAINDLGIEQASQEVVDGLVDLRETAEALLSVAPLPEPLREQVTQLAELVQGIDIEAVFAPVEAAVAQFDIPDSVAVEVTAGIETVGEVVANLIPAELIASIEAEVNGVLDVIRGFDPAALLEGVSGFIDETADRIDAVSVADAVGPIAAPFQRVLDLVDELQPDRLLAPVIAAYDDLIGRIPSPAPSTVVDRAVGTVSAAAETVSRTATAPARGLVPPTSGSATAELGPPEATLPGDFVRLLGYLPNKLREALAELEAGPAGEVLAAIDRVTGGLARDLRGLRAEIGAVEGRLESGIDALLAPVGVAQSRAQLRVRANFSTGGLDLTSAMTLTAAAGPGTLRDALAGPVGAARSQARRIASGAGGGIGLALGQTADLLEASSLGRLSGDLDAFLAALDPEPIAAELDGLVVAAMAKIPETIEAVGDTFTAALERIASLMEELNPGVQAQRLLEVLGVLQEELDLLNPRRLAADLGEIHAAIRETIAAYDPRIFAAEVDGVLDEIATSLRGLSPAALLGDIDFLADTVALVENAVPTAALAGVGESLTEIGATLRGLDLAALLDSIETLGPSVVAAFKAVAVAIRNEIVALLESLRYATGSASVSVQVGAGT